MTQQVYLAGLVFLSVAVVFLFYQNIKMERKYNKEIQFLNTSMKEVTQMIALNNDISIDKGSEAKELVGGQSLSMPEPRVSENMQQEMSNLMQDYSSYNEEQNLKLTVENDLDIEETKELNDIDDINDVNDNGDKYDSISEELKREIENLEKRDSSSENLDDSENGLEIEVNNGVLDLETELNEENLDANEEVAAEVVEELEVENKELEEEEVSEQEEELEEINLEREDGTTINEDMLGELNTEIKTEAGTFKNMVDEIIATASEAENNLESENTEGNPKWDGKVENTSEGMYLVFDNERKLVDSLNVKELTLLCKMCSIKTKGKKSELIERFKDYNTQKENTFFLESN